MAGPEPGAPALRSAALAKAVEEFRAAAKVVGMNVPDNQRLVEAVVRRSVRAYLLEDRKARGVDKRVSPVTVAMTEMQVGETREMPPMAPQTARCRMRSARKIMNNQLATWVCLNKNGKTFITRREDGARPERNLLLSEKAVFLASLKVGQGYVRTDLFSHRRSLSTNVKITARRILGEPDANWQAMTRRDGIYVRRMR